MPRNLVRISLQPDDIYWRNHSMSDFPETNHSLIARVQDLGDGASWSEFLRIYQPVVYRMARKRQLQEADAHDVVQQVFLSISRSIERWEPGAGQPPFRAWLTTIARNAITKALVRRPQDQATGTTSAAELLASHPEPKLRPVKSWPRLAGKSSVGQPNKSGQNSAKRFGSYFN